MNMAYPYEMQWLDPLLVGWFVLTALALAYVAWDAFTRNPELKVMKWAGSWSPFMAGP